MNWYAVYTKPRWEKKVHQLCRQRGIESYCPLSKVVRRWSDRVKVIDEPLFRSYVFVRTNEESFLRVKMIDGIVNFVHWLGKPAVIKDQEISVIKRFLNEHQDVEMVKFSPLKIGSKAVVQKGIFMNETGMVLKVRNKSVELRLEKLGVALVAVLDKSSVIPLS
ncbi:MAG TPA: UpxY family transcription antiterminator [Parasegetibacter sp.]